MPLMTKGPSSHDVCSTPCRSARRWYCASICCARKPESRRLVTPWSWSTWFAGMLQLLQYGVVLPRAPIRQGADGGDKGFGQRRLPVDGCNIALHDIEDWSRRATIGQGSNYTILSQHSAKLSGAVRDWEFTLGGRKELFSGLTSGRSDIQRIEAGNGCVRHQGLLHSLAELHGKGFMSRCQKYKKSDENEDRIAE